MKPLRALAISLLLGALLSTALAWLLAAAAVLPGTTPGSAFTSTTWTGGWPRPLNSPPPSADPSPMSPHASIAVAHNCGITRRQWIMTGRRGGMGMIDVFSTGWPARSAAWTTDIGVRNTTYPVWPWWRRMWEFGVEIPWGSQQGARTWAWRRLPVRPVWTGLAINSLTYGSVLWAVWTLNPRQRRRRRLARGLCPHCAYPIGVSPVCTECGTALPPAPSTRPTHADPAPCAPVPPS